MEESKVKLFHDDCLEILPTLPDKSIDCIIADLPYNINADTWDKIDKYIDWLKAVFKELRRVLKDNGSMYWFHSEMKIVSEMMVHFERETDFVFRQFIVWNKRFEGSKNKGFLDGFVVVDELRNYQQMAEYILFYSLENNSKGHSKIFDVMRHRMNEERIKAGLSLKQVNKLLGVATNGGGMACHYFSEGNKIWELPTKENYQKLQTTGYFQTPYEILRTEYLSLKKQYEDSLYYFDNQKTHHSVWNYDISGATGHATPKPVDLIKNILKHSTKIGDTVLDPTAGSGSTIKACKDLQRNCIAIEMSEKYYKRIKKQIISQTNLFQFEKQFVGVNQIPLLLASLDDKHSRR